MDPTNWNHPMYSAPDVSLLVDDREKAIRADLELVAEFLQDPPCLEYRDARSYSYKRDDGSEGWRIIPAAYTGRPALLALLAKDDAEFGRIVRETVEKAIRERAELDVQDEMDGAL